MRVRFDIIDRFDLAVRQELANDLEQKHTLACSRRTRYPKHRDDRVSLLCIRQPTLVNRRQDRFELLRTVHETSVTNISQAGANTVHNVPLDQLIILF